jgi:hypothetical protein
MKITTFPSFERVADWKPAIRQSKTLRYIPGALWPKYATNEF